MYEEQLKLAMELAIKAGCNMKPYLDNRGTAVETDLDIVTKSNENDLQTQIDVANEELVKEGIKERFPDHCIIGEESSKNSRDELTDAPTWIIDPIDGTTNFSIGLPLTCVSIGYCENKLPVMGVVYVPATNELFHAVKGEGAYRNAVQIHVDYASLPPVSSLKEAVICFEFGSIRNQDHIQAMYGAVNKLLENGCKSMKCLGSGVLDLCYVASGRLNVVYTGIAGEGWSAWDYCAGSIICLEAGCTLESLYKHDIVDYDDCYTTTITTTAAEDDQYKFDLYSESMICASSKTLVHECRKVLDCEKLRPANLSKR